MKKLIKVYGFFTLIFLLMTLQYCMKFVHFLLIMNKNIREPVNVLLNKIKSKIEPNDNL